MTSYKEKDLSHSGGSLTPQDHVWLLGWGKHGQGEGRKDPTSMMMVEVEDLVMSDRREERRLGVTCIVSAGPPLGRVAKARSNPQSIVPCVSQCGLNIQFCLMTGHGAT